MKQKTFQCDIKLFCYTYVSKEINCDGKYYFLMRSPSGKCRMICIPLILNNSDTEKVEKLPLFLPITINKQDKTTVNCISFNKICINDIAIRTDKLIVGKSPFYEYLLNTLGEKKLHLVFKLINDYNASMYYMYSNNVKMKYYNDTGESLFAVFNNQQIDVDTLTAFGEFYNILFKLCKDFPEYWLSKGIVEFTEEEASEQLILIDKMV